MSGYTYQRCLKTQHLNTIFLFCSNNLGVLTMSNKLTINYIALILAIIMLFSGSATAITEDFSAIGSKKVLNICACDLKEEAVTIHNTGDVTSTYMLFTEGAAAQWVDIAPATFYLESGETKEAKQFIKVPCSARGEYELNTTVKTIFEKEKTLTQTLNVQNCPNVQIIPLFGGIQQECPCTPVQYGFEVLNTGNHIETYEISVEPYSEAISLSTPVMVLEPGEKQRVDVFINLPCGEYGTKVFTLNTKAQGTKILGQMDFVLDISKCYDYAVEVGTEYTTCQGIPNIIPYNVRNNADIANTYIMTTEGVDWAYPENTTISTWGGEEKQSNILLFPPLAEEAETHTFILRSLSARGEEMTESEITVTNEVCYDYWYEQDYQSVVACETEEKEFTIVNTGSREATYSVYVEGPEWFTTALDNVIVPAQDSTQIPIQTTVPCDVAGEYALNIYTTIEDVNQTFVEEKILNVVTKEEAYIPTIEIPNIKIGYEGGDFEAKITNSGYKTATYDTYLVASDWVSIDKTRVTLAPGENATLLISTYPTEEVVEDVYIAELVAQVQGEGIEYAAGFTVALGQQSTLEKYWWALAAIGGLILLIIIILVIVLTSGKKDDKQPKKDSTTTIVKTDDKPKKKTHNIVDNEYGRQKKTKDKKVKVWPFILGAILILIILGAGVYFGATSLMNTFNNDGNETTEGGFEGYSEDVSEIEQTIEEPDHITEEPEIVEEEIDMYTNENIVDSLITIDRSGIPGSGNTLKIAENEEVLTLPMTVINPTDRRAKLEIGTTESSWINFDKDALAIDAESSETVEVTITPNHEVLSENDYEVTISATLEGSKIFYEEELELEISKKKKFTETIWPWIIGGIIALGIILLVVLMVSKREKKPKPVKAEKPAKIKKEKAPKIVKPSKPKKQKGWILPIVIAIIAIIILAGLGVGAYILFGNSDGTEQTTDTTEDVIEEPEQTVDETPVKLTEDDVTESLIVIDRSMVPGNGNILVMKDDQYSLPISITNPTERKAMFTINTGNSDWIVFDQYKILVEPESIKNINMTIVPDADALRENDYTVSINATLSGQRIDYEERLVFELKSGEPKIPWWAWAILALIVVGLVVLIVELVKRSKKADKSAAKKKKSSKKTKKSKKSTKKQKPEDTGKELKDINKELAAMRKKVSKKMKKMSK